MTNKDAWFGWRFLVLPGGGFLSNLWSLVGFTTVRTSWLLPLFALLGFYKYYDFLGFIDVRALEALQLLGLLGVAKKKRSATLQNGKCRKANAKPNSKTTFAKPNCRGIARK